MIPREIRENGLDFRAFSPLATGEEPRNALHIRFIDAGNGGCDVDGHGEKKERNQKTRAPARKGNAVRMLRSRTEPFRPKEEEQAEGEERAVHDAGSMAYGKFSVKK